VSDDPSRPANNRLGFNIYFGPDFAGIVVPHWLLIFLTAFGAASASVGRVIWFRIGPLKCYGRYLRIAFSVACGLACMTLIVWWARSYVYSDTLTGPMSESKRLLVSSLAGAIQFRMDDRGWSDANAYRSRIATDAVADLNKLLDDLSEMRSKLGLKQTRTKIDMTMRIGWERDTLFLPYWLLVLLTGGSAAALGMRRPYRFKFGLRTLLIATTLVALVLSLIAYAVRS